MIAAAIAPPRIEVRDAPRTICPPPQLPAPIPQDRAIEIETPPF
jgi:hypothetical protein